MEAVPLVGPLPVAMEKMVPSLMGLFLTPLPPRSPVMLLGVLRMMEVLSPAPA